jgi:thiol-disulfide isomerase/thioredoxin
MLKSVLLVLFLTLSLSAYRVGDSVDSETIQKLKIDNEKVTVVDFFASWCKSCRKELPLVSKLYRETKNSSQIEILGVDVDKSRRRGLRFQKRMGIEFRVHNDESQETIKKFKPFGMPSLYYIKDGKIVKVRVGAIPKIDKIIRKDLKSMGVKL